MQELAGGTTQVPPVESQVCLTCKLSKAITSFCLDRSRRNGRSPICKDCRNGWAKEYRKQNPHLDHESHLKSRYNLTKEEFDALLAQQEGRCAICRSDSPGVRKRRWHVDHDHETGQVRGLLCGPCNSALGYLKDDVEILRAAIRYLESARCIQTTSS